MNQKDLTKPFMMISSWKKTFGPNGLYKNNSALWVLTLMLLNCFLIFFIHFKPAIADAISSSKWQKILLFFETWASVEINYLPYRASITNYSSGHFIWSESCWKPCITNKHETLIYCWPTVYDVGPTTLQSWADFLGIQSQQHKG